MAKQTEIQNRIRRLRFDAGEMTQQALADRAGVTRQTIIALEAGAYAPSLLLAFRLAGVFGVTVEEVFQYTSGAKSNDHVKITNSRRLPAGNRPPATIFIVRQSLIKKLAGTQSQAGGDADEGIAGAQFFGPESLRQHTMHADDLR